MELDGITDLEFASIRTILFKHTGISLTPAKKALVSSRLFKRIQTLGLSSFGEYFDLLGAGRHLDEVQTAVNLLTTNETYFFREPQHFRMLEQIAERASRDRVLRVWSAASSSGEEAYSIAMTLAELERKGRCPDWQVRGSDISTQVLETASQGLYRIDRADDIPHELLKRYCLRGSGVYEGTILIERSLRERVGFSQINLIEPLPHLVPFDVIFLRNVLIYFDPPVKRQVVAQLLAQLAPDGVLFVGMAESLSGLFADLVSIGPGAYRIERRQ